MKDERVEKMARLLAEYCIGAGERDQVLIEGSSAAEPLVKELYVRLLLRGAIPIPLVHLPDTEELFFEHAKDIHYRKTPLAVWAHNERADAFITITALTNTRALAAVDPSKQQALAKRDKDLQEMIERKDRWVLTLFPTEAHLALGYSLPETGGKNRSGMHWDLICDLREGGELYADGGLTQKDGRFADADLG